MNVRQEAYEIIVRVLKHKEYSDILLRQRSRKLKPDEPGQIALMYQIVKGVIKYKLHLDYICTRFTEAERFAKTDIRTKALLYLGLYQLKFMHSIPDHAAIHETVELSKSMFGESVGGFVNSILRSYQRHPELSYPEDPAQRISLEHSYPASLISQWIANWGVEQTELLAMFFNENPKLHLRVNTAATDANKLIHYLTKREIKCDISTASRNIIVCEDGVEALEDVAFSEGYFSVQDTSAALIVELLDPQPDESILDLFAAPGGKCTYIAERMNNTGEIIAVDKSPGKLKMLKQAVERIQLDNIKIVVQDAFNYGPVAPAFNRVLVDAPCSGWGVMGRKADLRWQQHQDIPELLRIQEKALNYAAYFVKKGGIMVYSTCTMNRQENEDMVQQFLDKHDEFVLDEAGQFVLSTYTRDGFIRTIPYQHLMDGAFAARLRKKQ